YEEEGPIGGLANRSALIDGTGAPHEVIDLQDRTARVYGRVPSGDGAVLGHEDERRRRRLAAARNVESRSAAVEHLPGGAGRCGLPLRWCNRNRGMPGDLQRGSVVVVARSHSHAVVRNKKWSFRGDRNTPGVDQV